MASPTHITALPKRRWYQYSLRSLVIVVTLCAIGSFVWRRELGRWLLPDPNPITVLPLKYARADVAADLLHQIFAQEEKGIRISFDNSSNSISVQADVEQIEIINELMKVIDQSNRSLEGCCVVHKPRLFQLANADAKQCVTELRAQFSGVDAQFSYDAHSNSVVVSGHEKILEQVEQILQARDVPSE